MYEKRSLVTHDALFKHKVCLHFKICIRHIFGVHSAHAQYVRKKSLDRKPGHPSKPDPAESSSRHYVLPSP